MYRNAWLIYNPNAGGLIRKPDAAARVAAVLGERAVAVRPKPTSGPGHATRLAAEAIAAGADLVIAMGGDGTVNEVLNGMVGSRVPLAVIPGGTANVYCCEIGIPRHAEKAARLLPDWKPVRIGLGRLVARGGAGPADPRHFLLMAGAGLDARVVERVKPGIKRRLGKLAYWLAGLSTFGRALAIFQVRTGGREFVTGFALAARVRNYGGELAIAANASLHTDRFELVTFAGRSTFPYGIYLAGAVVGQAARFPGVTSQFTRHLELAPIDGDPVYIQVDGELAGRLPATIDLVDDSLTILMPASAAAAAHG